VAHVNAGVRGSLPQDLTEGLSEPV